MTGNIFTSKVLLQCITKHVTYTTATPVCNTRHSVATHVYDFTSQKTSVLILLSLCLFIHITWIAVLYSSCF